MQAWKACDALPSQLTGAVEVQQFEQPAERWKLLQLRGGSD